MVSLQIRRVLIYTSALCGAVALAVLTPVALDAYAAHKTQQEHLRYATGLYPCTFHWQAFSEYIDSQLPGPPDVSIDVVPSFDGPRAIRIVGRDIYYFRVDERTTKQISRVGRDGIGSVSERADVTRSSITEKTSNMLARVITREVVEARAKEPMGLDGTTYKFQTGGTNRCAMAWSPGADERAHRVVSLYYSALNYTTNSKDHPVTEQQFQRQIKELLDL